ncbi:MAG: FadR/GntR family transcriptional regulator [Lachnospiraceae bacterium]|nr:FadR/GntR family transcriptional regulator [Lachnospiraceae bacterium]
MDTVKRVPIVQQVVESIKEYMFSGDVNPGDKLPAEKELCEKLGVGRGTIREAFRMLQATGYVEIKPGRGAFVARTSEIEMSEVVNWISEHEVETKDFNEVRMAIEPLAVRYAIERCTDAEVLNLQRIHNNFMEAVEENDVPKIVLLDEEFHSTIVEYSKNKLLISIMKQINHYLKSFRSKTFYIPTNAKNAIKPHSEIMAAFVERNHEKGEANMIQHLQSVLVDMEKSKS